MDLHQGLIDWCRQWLGAEPDQTLFALRQLSSVFGLRLSDGREVVIKLRPPAERLRACAIVQRRLWASGFPCPELLAGPAPLGAQTATAEASIPGGEPLPRDAAAPRRYAEALQPLSDATPAESAAFLDAYATARGRPWSPEERRASWAAGLWVRAFNAKKAFVRNPSSPVVGHLERELAARMAEAGLV